MPISWSKLSRTSSTGLGLELELELDWAVPNLTGLPAEESALVLPMELLLLLKGE